MSKEGNGGNASLHAAALVTVEFYSTCVTSKTILATYNMYLDLADLYVQKPRRVNQVFCVCELILHNAEAKWNKCF